MNATLKPAQIWSNILLSHLYVLYKISKMSVGNDFP